MSRKVVDLTPFSKNGGGGGGSGVDDKYYEFTQNIASNEWVINHNLNKKPSIMTVDSADNVVIGEETYIDNNNIVIKFNGRFKGKAYLN